MSTEQVVIPNHCSICNRIFVYENKKNNLCPFCGSPYVHEADATCKGMTFNEWKDDEKIASLLETIPDSTGYSTDTDF